MLLVLLIHANMWNEKRPCLDLQTSFTSSATTIFLQSLSCVCVNVFVLISGWFGIKFSLKKMLKFVFQCAFFLFGIYAAMIILGLRKIDIVGISGCLMFLKWNWFIKAYLLLFIVSPILNRFLENTNGRELRLLLILFFSFQTLYGWATTGAYFFEWGLSVTSFVGLYLLAQYIRRYRCDLIFIKGGGITRAYILSTLFLFVLTLISVYFKFDYLTGKIFAYTSPIVILNSLLLLLIFVNIDRIGFVCPAINKIAASSFAVFLIHTNPNIFEDFYQKFSWYIYTNSGSYYIPLLFIWMLSVFAMGIIIDQVRIFCWNKIEPILNKYLKWPKTYP